MRRILQDEQIQRERIAYLHGRIEREIEAFADSLDLPKMELTQRLGALLLGIGQGYADHLPSVSGGRRHLEAGQGSDVLATLEGAVEPHGRSAQPERIEASVGTRQAHTHEVKAEYSKASKGYWAKMSPLQRKREMMRRQSLWSTRALKKWGGTKAVKQAKKLTAKKTVKKAAKAAPVLEQAA
jgi:hypothetical protein